MSKNAKLTPGDSLSSMERHIAALIASGLTHNEVAVTVGKSHGTVARVACRPAVRKAVDDIRHAVIDAGLGELCATFRAAVKELARIVKDGTAADGVRLGACRVTIESVLKVREQVELTRRIEALETIDAMKVSS